MSKIKLSEPQIKALQCRKPLVLIMAGQGGGKSYGIGLRSSIFVRNFPRMIGMIAANTYMQLTQSTLVEVRRVWKNVFDITEFDKNGNPNGVYVLGRKPPIHFKKFHEFDDYKGIISFRNGAVIFTASLDNYLAHEGKTIGWADLDETKETKEQAVKIVILARLRQIGLYYDESGNIIYSEKRTSGLTPYNPCYINTSPAEGTVDWLEKMFNLKNKDEKILEAILPTNSYFFEESATTAVIIYSSYWNAQNLPANFIENRKTQLSDGEQLKFIYGYPFSKTGGEYFHEFSRTAHVKPVVRNINSPDHLTYDFNVWPYMTLLCCQIEELEDEFNFNFYKEYCLKPPENSTTAVTKAFVDDNLGRLTDIFYYGDAMGTRQIEGFGNGVTRFDDVRKTLGFLVNDESDRTSRSNPGVNKRRNLINRIFSGKVWLGHKKVNIYVNGFECPELVRDLTYLKQGVNGKLKEIVKDENTGVKYEKLGHTSDAMEYLVCEILEDFI